MNVAHVGTLQCGHAFTRTQFSAPESEMLTAVQCAQRFNGWTLLESTFALCLGKEFLFLSPRLFVDTAGGKEAERV